MIKRKAIALLIAVMVFALSAAISRSEVGGSTGQILKEGKTTALRAQLTALGDYEALTSNPPLPTFAGAINAGGIQKAAFKLVGAPAGSTGRIAVLVDKSLTAEVSVYGPGDPGHTRPLARIYPRFSGALGAFKAEKAGDYVLEIKALKGNGSYLMVADNFTNGLLARATDVNGDYASDALALYNYGNASSSLWAFYSTYEETPKFSPVVSWRSGPGTFDTYRQTVVVGDFDGDGRTDVISMYGYDSNTSALWLWKGMPDGFAEPTRVFYSTGWEWGRTKMVAGDFDKDGRDEVLAFYLYAGTKTGILFFDTAADGSLIYPKLIFYSDSWDLGRTTLAVMAPNLKNEVSVAAFYGYEGTKTALWRFKPSADMAGITPVKVFEANDIIYENARVMSGDINGSFDPEVLVASGVGDSTTIYEFANMDGASADRSVIWHSDYWAISRSNFIFDDYNSDGFSDLLCFYDYGGGAMNAWLFSSFLGELQPTPTSMYATPYWDNARARWLKQQ